MPRKNARKAGFINGTADYQITDGSDFRATIRAKDFPAVGPNGEFRVYRVEGDITRPDCLHAAIGRLLTERGIVRRLIIVNY